MYTRPSHPQETVHNVHFRNVLRVGDGIISILIHEVLRILTSLYVVVMTTFLRFMRLYAFTIASLNNTIQLIKVYEYLIILMIFWDF